MTCAFLGVVGWRVFEHAMRAKVRARIAEVGPRRMGEKEKEKEKEGRIPMEELEFVGGAFSTDEARRGEFRRRMAELERFWTAVGFGSRDALDFVEVLKRLGVEVPTGMTNAQAAAEFLRQAAGVKETLAMIRRDLERGPWRWEKDVALHPEKWPAHNEVLEVFWVGLPLQAAFTEAEWLGGDKTAGAEAMSLLSAAQKQLSTGDPALRLFLGEQIGSSAGRLFAKGVALSQWSDAQVRDLAAAMPPSPSVQDLQAALEAQRQTLIEASSSPETLQRMRDGMRAPPWGKWTSLEGVAASIAKTIISDAQLSDAVALGVADVDRKLALVDADAGAFVDGEQPPLVKEIYDQGNVFEKAFAAPAWSLPGFAADSLSRAFTRGERETQAGRQMAALELHRRQHGSYPETLDALPAAPGVAAPSQNASATKTSYSLDAAGGYVLRIGATEFKSPAAKR